MSRIAAPTPSSPVRAAVHVLSVNLGIFLALLVALEVGYRLYRDGFPGAITKFVENFGVPYSNVGTSHWIIYDDTIGYRLNPDGPGINDRCVRHPEIVVPKPAGLCRILFLGDSIPWASPWVDPSLGFVKLISDRLGGDRYEVINAGVPGYTTYQEIEFFKRYLVDTQPDLVVWTYCLNDNHKFLHRCNEDANLLWTAEAEQSLSIDSAFDRIVSYSYVLTQLRLGLLGVLQKEKASKKKFIWETRTDVNIAWKDYSWGKFEGYLREMKDLLEQSGTSLCMVVFPFEPQIVVHRFEDHELDYVFKPQNIVTSLCRTYGIPCLDLRQPLIDHQYATNRGVFVDDNVHLNPAGHRIAAEAIWSFLDRGALLERCGAAPG